MAHLLLQLLGVFIAILIAACIYLKNVTYNYWRNKGVHQAEPVLPFGSMWPLIKGEKSIGEAMRDLHLKFKDTPAFGFYSFHRPSLVIRDPDLVRFVLTKEFMHFHDRGILINEEVEPLFSNMFVLPGEKWRILRTRFTPTFTSGKMKNMFNTMKECSDNLVRCLAKEMTDNECIEIKDLLARYSTDVIGTVAFGIECNSLKNPNAEFRSWGRKFLEPKPITNMLLMLCPSLFKLFKIRVIEKDLSNFFIGTFEKAVEYRTANNIVRKDFLDLVMQLINKGYVQRDDDMESPNEPEAASGKITMVDGAAQVFLYWLAGFETSSSAATHCLYEMALNQKVQEKLADEITRVLKEFGGLTYESIVAMPYLHKVVSETLRKYPSLPILNRECTRDMELPGTGLRVTTGTPIVISVWGLHSDPELYPEPDKFDPERFSEENIASRHRYAYLPFGEGPRNCIGMRFGLLQMKIALVSLLSKYRFDVGPDTPVPLPIDRGNIFLFPKDGVPLVIKHR